MERPDETYWRVGFDDETAAMVVELSEACHCAPEDLITAIVRDVLVDDLAAHGGTVHAHGEENDPSPTLN
jgi:hypothetical protein